MIRISSLPPSHAHSTDRLREGRCVWCGVFAGPPGMFVHPGRLQSAAAHSLIHPSTTPRFLPGRRKVGVVVSGRRSAVSAL
ncbi:unnamed protein product [Vitrella brassicaformis CCMP3155]|uniref:Uncharacterized protein n=1 Tax=Vitrella brassicaformis (strain CCMP3155) TaxID=1169540 RepID=A0A0G4H366_VITBC|nr:unnamed protein product [Vitrella brassicaformis CCMP3155]|eukprot:CEM38146.1 unnamed protein product [Vitrella brassicaformis CCMP3155]